MDIAIDITNAEIATERLILRPWKETDLQDFYEYASVPGVGEMAGWKHHDSVEISRKILQSFLAEKNVFAIVYRDIDKVIGSLGLHPSWASREKGYAQLKVKEIGYVLSKEYWGKGLMTEAVRAVIAYCFDKCGLDALTVGHFKFNCRSQRVIEKCGFSFVKQSKYDAKQLRETYTDKKYILLHKS